MGLKQCSKCGKWKDEEEFSWRWQSLGKRHAACKECHKGKREDYYNRNREKYIAGVMVSKNARREEDRPYVDEYLRTHRCVGCGERDPVVLEFDHVQGEKVNSIATMVMNGAPLESIKEEITKCEVVCSNCHTRRTSRQFGWRKGKR